MKFHHDDSSEITSTLAGTQAIESNNHSPNSLQGIFPHFNTPLLEEYAHRWVNRYPTIPIERIDLYKRSSTSENGSNGFKVTEVKKKSTKSLKRRQQNPLDGALNSVPDLMGNEAGKKRSK